MKLCTNPSARTNCWGHRKREASWHARHHERQGLLLTVLSKRLRWR